MSGTHFRRGGWAALLLLGLGWATAQAGAPAVTEAWVARYNGPGNNYDDARKVVVDGGGNVYVTGQSIGYDTGHDYATVKYDASGTQQWVARYNGPGNSSDQAFALAVDGSGNVYVTGQSIGDGTNADYATVKYDASGTQQWVQRYNGPGNSSDVAQALAVDGSGNVYVTGYSIGDGTNADYATVKYDASGTQQWVQRYNGPGNAHDYAQALAVDSGGNVYITGYSAGSDTGGDYATVKYDASGSQQWVARYNGPGNGDDYAQALAMDGSGNVYVTGYSHGGSTSDDYATVKYDVSGTQVWVARYNGPGNGGDYAQALAMDGSGNVYVTGASRGSSTSDDYATVKYDVSGNQMWVARYNGSGTAYDYATAIAVEGSGNVYVTGYSSGSDTSNDYATVKYNAIGAQQWVARYNGPVSSSDQANSLAVDGGGNVYVTGVSGGIGFDSATIKYTQPDATAPTAAQLAVVTESPTRVYVPFNLTDAGSGLAKARLTSNSTNCVLEWTGPGGVVTKAIGQDLPFSPAGLGSTQVRVVKVNAGLRARVEVQVWDVAGNLALVDPVIASLELKGRQLARVFPQLPQAERYITLQNGTPGLARATLAVNGKVVSHGRLSAGQVVTLDVVRWLRPGNRNVVRITAGGLKGATALFIISDQAAGAGAPVAAGAAVNLEFAP